MSIHNKLTLRKWQWECLSRTKTLLWYTNLRRRKFFVPYFVSEFLSWIIYVLRLIRGGNLRHHHREVWNSSRSIELWNEYTAPDFSLECLVRRWGDDKYRGKYELELFLLLKNTKLFFLLVKFKDVKVRLRWNGKLMELFMKRKWDVRFE